MKVAVDTSSLENIANSIRLKNGLTTEYKPSEMASAIDNLPSGGADLSDYFESTISAGTSSASGIASMLKTIPENTIVSGTSLNYAFYNCSGLLSVPLLDTSNVLSAQYMFSGCTNLVTIPIFDFPHVTNIRNMFRNCSSLSDNSLDNILQMCIGATSYTSAKTLANLGLTSTAYPTSRIEALPHYSAFTSAGWTIGY